MKVIWYAQTIPHPFFQKKHIPKSRDISAFGILGAQAFRLYIHTVV